MDRLRTSTRTLVIAVLLAAGVPLAPPPVQAQTILTVGPDGNFTSIQSAIDAVVVGANTEIRIQGGGLTFSENLDIPNSFTSGSLLVRGGWNTTFTVPSNDPEDSIVNGGGSRVIDIAPGGGTLEIRGLTFTNGSAQQGAGVHVAPVGNPVITLRDCLIAENTATAAGDTLGGGLWAILIGTQELEIADCSFLQNQSTSTSGGLANAGGAGIIASESSRVAIRRTEFIENHVGTTGAGSSGGGLLLELSNTAEADLEDCLFYGNTGTNSQATVLGTGSWISTQDSAVLRATRDIWALNEGVGTDTGPQCGSSLQGQSSMTLREAGIVHGDSDGLMVSVQSTSVAHLTNLTVADNQGFGLDLTEQGGAATLTLYNTISYSNGTDLSQTGTVDADFNLIGVDPLFLDPSDFDYHLRIGSPAENAGTNSPPGGLSSLDLDGNSRIQDGIVDIGALEGIAEIFIDGFESGNTTAWSRTVP